MYTEKTIFPIPFKLNGIYDRGDSFPFNLESNGTAFGSKSKGKLSPRSYIPFNVKGIGSIVFSVH